MCRGRARVAWSDRLTRHIRSAPPKQRCPCARTQAGRANVETRPLCRVASSSLLVAPCDVRTMENLSRGAKALAEQASARVGERFDNVVQSCGGRKASSTSSTARVLAIQRRGARCALLRRPADREWVTGGESVQPTGRQELLLAAVKWRGRSVSASCGSRRRHGLVRTYGSRAPSYTATSAAAGLLLDSSHDCRTSGPHRARIRSPGREGS